jgi:catechol 2,3-dioxygenase-like lactoylglutathione lyase family enzyme
MKVNVKSLGILVCCGAVALVVRPMLGRAQSKPAGAVPIKSINHLQIRITDLKRTQEFYAKLLGAKIIDTSASTWTMSLPGTGSWLSFAKAQGNHPMTGQPVKPATLDHLGLGVDLRPANAANVRTTIKQAFPDAKVQSPGKPGDSTYDRSIYIDDPDGVRLQLIATDDDGHLPMPDPTPAVPRTAPEGVVRARSINHLMITVKDLNQSREFYIKLLGATVRDTSSNGITLTFRKSLPAWLSLSQVSDPSKAGVMDHLGIGIDWTPNAEAIRTKLKQAFPSAKVMSPGKPGDSTYDRSIYIDDPDGLRIQLISKDDDGNLPNSTMSK